MRYALIALGERFRDPELNGFIESTLRQGHEIFVFAPAIEKLQELTETAVFDVILVETYGCEKKPYVKAVNNLISLVFARAKVIVFLPLCPKEILEVAKEQWPGSAIFKLDYSKPGNKPVRLN
jgi:hypothetical protein